MLEIEIEMKVEVEVTSGCRSIAMQDANVRCKMQSSLGTAWNVRGILTSGIGSGSRLAVAEEAGGTIVHRTMSADR